MPEICQLVHSLNVGGAEILAERFSRRLGGPKRVMFACLDDLGPLGETLRAEGFAVHVLARKPGFDLGCVRNLGKLFRLENIKLVHAHQYTPYFYASLSRFFGPKVPILFTEHGRFFPDFPHRKRMWLNPLLVGKNDRLIAVGQCVKRALVDNEGFRAKTIDVIYNGVDLKRFTEDNALRRTVRQELGLTDDQIVFLTVARLDPIKDHANSLRAFAKLRNEIPFAKLIFAGDGPERANIEKLIAELNLQESVTLLGQRRDVPRLYAACDVFLLTSVSEGIPLTVIEAMGSQRPVLATAVGGLPEVVQNEETGLLVPAGDADKLAAGMSRLARDVDLRNRFRGAGETRARILFDEADMMARYDSLYREMLTEGK